MAKTCPVLKEHLPITDTDKILIKFKLHISLVQEGNKIMGSCLESFNSVILQWSVSCIPWLSFWNLMTVT